MASTDTPVGSMSKLLQAVETQVLTTDVFKDEQIEFFTSQAQTCIITDANGDQREVPTYFALVSQVVGSGGTVGVVASKLSEARIIELTGAVEGQVAFDGSTNVAIVTAIPAGSVPTSAVAGLDDTLQTLATNSATAVTKANAAVTAVNQLQAQLGSIVSGWTYNQINPAPVWVINHGMGKKPSITVLDSAGTKVICGIQYVDLNNVIITSAYPFAGSAIFN